MNKFIFQSKKYITDTYDHYVLRNKTLKYLVFEYSKVGVVFLFILISFFVYFRYISLASTEWYFLRQANNNLDAVSFQYDILQADILGKTQHNWENMHDGWARIDIIEVNTQIVYVPQNEMITMKD